MPFCRSAQGEISARTLTRPEQPYLLVIVDPELRTAVWVCHERHFLADVTVKGEEGVSNRIIGDISTAFVPKRVVDHHTGDRIVSLFLLTHDDGFRERCLKANTGLASGIDHSQAAHVENASAVQKERFLSRKHVKQRVRRYRAQ